VHFWQFHLRKGAVRKKKSIKTIKNMTTQRFFILLFSFALSTAMAQNSDYRRILIFALDDTNSVLKQQNQIFKEKTAECRERDMLVENYLYTFDNVKIFNEFQVHPTHFTLLLIGKDGYVKLRSKEVVSADYIFSIIDVMPMRMDEVKRKGE